MFLAYINTITAYGVNERLTYLGGMMLKKTLIASAFALSASSASACVSYNYDQTQGGGWGRFENRCGYTVLIRFRFNNGQDGVAGPLAAGRTDNYYHGSASSVNYRYCDHTSTCYVDPPAWPD